MNYSFYNNNNNNGFTNTSTKNIFYTSTILFI